jgi:hypothetical protein
VLPCCRYSACCDFEAWCALAGAVARHALWAGGGFLVNSLLRAADPVCPRGRRRIVAVVERRRSPRSLGWLAGAVCSPCSASADRRTGRRRVQRKALSDLRSSSNVSASAGDFLCAFNGAGTVAAAGHCRRFGGASRAILLPLAAVVPVMVAGGAASADRPVLGSAVCSSFLALGLNLTLGGWRPFSTLRSCSRPGWPAQSFRFVAVQQVCVPPAAPGSRQSGRTVPGPWRRLHHGAPGGDREPAIRSAQRLPTTVRSA